MTMPNFLSLGSMKCGTTSLYYYLKQHPQIYMSPVKAPNFFNWEGRKLYSNGPEGRAKVYPIVERMHATNIEEYRELFREVSDEKAIGEASTTYLYWPDTANQIRSYIPEAKFIAVLRNPVDRAYSAWTSVVQAGRETLDFAQALRAEEERIKNHWEWLWHYRSMGFYYSQLKRYYETFDRTQIKVYLYDDIQNDLTGVLRDIFRYLEVDDTFTPDTTYTYHASGIPKSRVHRTLQKLLVRPNPVKTILKTRLPQGPTRRLYESVQRMNLVKPPPLRPEVREELIEGYRQDIQGVQRLIQRDLSGWLEPTTASPSSEPLQQHPAAR